MSTNPNKLSRFWHELKRRNVARVFAVYAAAAFMILELVDIMSEPFGLPDWTLKLVFAILALGLVTAMIISWIFDVTPKGVEKTKPLSEVQEKDKPIVPNGWKVATYASIVVIIGLVVLNIFSGPKQLRAGDVQSLVVLPFDNLTGDDQLEYFVSGMHASLIGDMGKVGGMRVISKTSSNTYKDIDKSIPEIATELGVDAVVESTLMCLGDTICLQIRVITPFPEERQLWIADYKEEKSQILNLYNRITKQIASEVMIELTPEEKRLLDKSVTVNEEAYDAYLKGQQYWDQLSEESLQKAMEHMNTAIELDPDWAPPYAGVAIVWGGMMQMGFASPSVAAPEIAVNLNKSIELDSDFADLHFFIAALAVWMEWDWDKGEKSFLKALAINPNDVMSRIYYAHLLMILQRTDEALAQGHLAVGLDPLNPLVLALYSVVLAGAEEWDPALVHAEKAVTIDPENYFAYGVLEQVAIHNEDYEKALEAIWFQLPLEKEKIKEIEGIYENHGILTAYEEVLNQMGIMAQQQYVMPYDMAVRYYLVNQDDKVMDWLETGFNIHDPNMPYISSGFSKFDRLHGNPRYIDLVEKLNLPFPKN